MLFPVSYDQKIIENGYTDYVLRKVQCLLRFLQKSISLSLSLYLSLKFLKWAGKLGKVHILASTALANQPLKSWFYFYEKLKHDLIKSVNIEGYEIGLHIFNI